MNNNLNSVIVEGNLTKDAEFSSSPKGTEFCTFSLASNRYYKQGDDLAHEVSFFDVEVWGKLCESCRNLLTKGAGVRIVGRLKQDRWQDADGKNRTKIKIIAEHVEGRPHQKDEPAAEMIAVKIADENGNPVPPEVHTLQH
ncbi:MAG: single-stranded DNA-binding protein [Spirochaetia bacterium]|nr:single-stranded DNA-binding protein [Spirochaetia bacterium]